jgi:type I restriction enzyme S subunit
MRCKLGKVLPSFVTYYFKTPEGQHKLLANSSSVGVPSIAQPVSYVRKIEIPLPPLPEQRAIAAILGALDDKIELNCKMNRTLEAIARALFKQWFVDGAEAGWEVKTIGDLADIVGGSTPSTKESVYWENGVHHWVTPKDLSGVSVPILLDTERKITDLGVAQISSGVLPVGTVLLSSRAPIGYLAITEIPVCINQGFIAMKPKADVSNLFLLLWASFAHDEIVSRANGSTFLEISKSNFRPIQVVAPDRTVMASFDKTVRPLYARIVANERQSRTLAALHEALMPKLISGEVRVKNADMIVGATV